ncbi:MAG: hypothetical protein KBG00_17295 [Rhodoferax sp.]|jgi:hypothetical protein|uniref:cytochrome D1 domain-containing protein n=1 Tax=Rhodoferax sp. TaxID=50421 RepID=UPI001B5C742E|nr:cytochrome D1 domain-containing protein [Rhodoferax sp.]MBP9150534.1 hypothetical protein [Rhodoferax sp.]MBP9735630.1 hypothetical protein [Rhodoferax sp.]
MRAALLLASLVTSLNFAFAQPPDFSVVPGKLSLPDVNLQVHEHVPTQMGVQRPGLRPEVHRLPDGRHALMTTHDAWILRVDLEQAQVVAQVRVADSLGDAALSDIKSGLPAVLAVATARPHTLIFVDEHLRVLKQLPLTARAGRQTSAANELLTATARDSFVMSLADLPELWEISYRPTAPEIAQGMVHDFQYREGIFVPGYLNPRRISLESPAVELCMSSGGHEALVLAADSGLADLAGGRTVNVIHLDVGRHIAQLTLPVGWQLKQLAR